jgi:hypothetical protein
MKTFLATVAIAASGLFGYTPSAEARTCFEYVGGVLCNTYQHQNSHGHSVYSLGYYDGYFTESMDVVCAGPYMVTWRSNGNMNQRNADMMARNFCRM